VIIVATIAFRPLIQQVVKTVPRPFRSLYRHVTPGPQHGRSTKIYNITLEEGIYLDEYDVVLTNNIHETLKQTSAEEIGTEYLSETTNGTKGLCNGYIYGPNRRLIVPLVSYSKRFLYCDSGSIWTYLSQ